MEKKMKPLVSVIVPCYNSEKYIERCIISILNQTYNNIEIIIIDDGSTDSSLDIIKRLSNNYDNIKYIHQSNSGVSAARNKGLSNANGDYITFVDSDDTILPEMYETLMELIVSHKADISHCSYQRIKGNNIKKLGGTNLVEVYDSKTALAYLLKGEKFSPSICNKLYSKKCISNIRLNTEISINEDYLFNYFLFCNSKKIVYIDKCFYEYHNETVSSVTRINQIKRANDVLKTREIINETINQESDLKKQAELNVFKSQILLYRTYLYNKNNCTRNDLKQIRKTIVNSINELQINEKKTLLSALIIKYIPFLYKPIYNLYNKIREPNWDI